MTAEEKWKEALALLDSEQANEHGEEILQLLNEAISEGHAGAIFTMATLYYFGNGPLTQDRQKGLSLAQEALDKGYERAKRMLGYECLVGSSGPIDLQKGEQYYKDLVEGGHADACLQLATFYLDGTIPGKGYQDGLELIDKAFKLGNANVYLESADFFGKYCEDEKMNEMISRHLSYGGTVPQEFYDSYSPETLSSRRITLFRHFCEISQFDKAIAALKEGVSNGEIESEETLSDVYLYGLGENQYAQDIDLALKMFMSLSERGSGFADFRLAQYYRSFAENMEDENYQMAMNYLRKSVDKGYAHAQLVMARIVAEQDKDQVLAKKYLESAAEGADPEALRVLGESYLQDSEIVPDSDFIYELDAKKGIDYLIAATQCNDPVAMYYLSKCYRDGKYVDKNELFAMDLLRRSVASSPNADNLLLLADFYKDGTGVDKDLEAAFDINKSVADNEKSLVALYRVYEMYRDGIGVEKNEELALEYLNKHKEVFDELLYGTIPLDEAKQKAKGGDPEAMYQLGQRYQNGDGVEANIETASDWWLKAAMKGHPAAMNDLGIFYLDQKNDKTNGFKWLEKASEKGYTTSMRALSDFYLNGKYVEADPQKSLYYIEKAANLDDEQAQYTICSYYHEGIVVQKDLTMAKQWFEKFYAHKSGLCYFRMALCYLNGDMYPQDNDKAIEQLELAIENRYEEAYRCYSDLLWYGNRVPKDHERILSFFKERAEKYDSLAKYYLYEFYSNEKNQEFDIEQAKAYLQDAADCGHDVSECELGVNLVRGSLFEKNTEEGFKYLEASARQYHAEAMGWLGFFLRNGEGCEKDVLKALQWFEAGAYYGNEYSAIQAAEMYQEGVDGLVEKDLYKAANIIYPFTEKSVEACYHFALILEDIAMSPNNYTWENAKLAFDSMFRAANAGHIEALYLLAKYYRWGQGCVQDTQMALRCYDMILEDDSLPEESQERVRQLKSETQENSEYDRFYYLHHLIESNPDKVKTKESHINENDGMLPNVILQKAMECGEVGAYVDSSVRECTVNPQRSIECAKYASEHGETSYLKDMGLVYLNGQGVEQDVQVAEAYFELGARAGNQQCILWKAYLMTLEGNSPEMIEEGVQLLNQLVANNEPDSKLYCDANEMLKIINSRERSVLGKIKSFFKKK